MSLTAQMVSVFKLVQYQILDNYILKISDKIDKYSYSEEDPVVYDTEYDQLEDEYDEEDWTFGGWK